MTFPIHSFSAIRPSPPHTRIETTEIDPECSPQENRPENFSPPKLNGEVERLSPAEERALEEMLQEQEYRRWDDYDAFLEFFCGDDESMKQQARMGRFTFERFVSEQYSSIPTGNRAVGNDQAETIQTNVW